MCVVCAYVVCVYGLCGVRVCVRVRVCVLLPIFCVHICVCMCVCVFICVYMYVYLCLYMISFIVPESNCHIKIDQTSAELMFCAFLNLLQKYICLVLHISIFTSFYPCVCHVVISVS